MTYKIGILIPSTTKDLNCKKYSDTLLYKIFLNSFYKTYSKTFNNIPLHYYIYVVVDKDDKIYSKKTEIDKLVSFIKLFKNVNIKFIINNDIAKGWVTVMWNRAFLNAYDDGCDYFYQCGDDIEFLDKNWGVNFINILLKHDNIGLTGPLDWGRELFKKKNNCNQKFLLTQTFVSRKHMDFFGFYFPKEIKNWYCDDWITYVYASKKKCYPSKCRIFNRGGQPRYNPIGRDNYSRMMMIKLTQELIQKYNKNLPNF